jgi:hypothetical protein
VTTSQIPVSIYNCGDTPLILGNIMSMQTSGPVGGALTIDSAPSVGTAIPPQACPTTPPSGPAGATFNVDFNGSTNGSYGGTVTVPSNDPITPSAVVSVLVTKT